MMTYTLKLQLESDLLSGSGQGFGAIIDSDIVFDETGLPFIPAKRVKGCLLSAAQEMLVMFGEDNFKTFFNEDFNSLKEKLFGKPGAVQSAPCYFGSLYLEEHRKTTEALNALSAGSLKGILTPETILDVFTSIRQQTKIDEDGVAEDKSLRTSRVLNHKFKGKAITFFGDVLFEDVDENALRLLAVTCKNLRRIGSNRTRGFGEVKCILMQNDNDVTEKYFNKIEKGAAK